MSYTWEKFHHAMRSLASWGSIQDRLCSAYVDHLIHLRVEELPEEILDEFERLSEELTSGKPVGEEGTVAAFCRELTDIEAFNYVEKIISMYDTVICYEQSS